MDLVVVELNAVAELDTTEYVEVAGAELIGGMDLISGRGRQMERESWPGRHAAQAGDTVEFVREPRARAALASSAGGVRPASGGRAGEQSPSHASGGA
jgi:hypothetical protein